MTAFTESVVEEAAVVLFVNGLPLAVLELKNAADEGATVWAAFQQLQTYQALTKAFALSVPHEEALRIRDDVGY
jgi:type I site-specific restriction-modification system R (restriction) subunit